MTPLEYGAAGLFVCALLICVIAMKSPRGWEDDQHSDFDGN